MKPIALMLFFAVAATFATCAGLELKHVADQRHEAYEQMLEALEPPKAPGRSE